MTPHSQPLEAPELELEPIETSPPETERAGRDAPPFSITLVGGVPT